jgi:diguanylate cyclase (GGDEF)-like protein
VLRLFAHVLKAEVRSSDLLARYGGEEFLVVMENADRDAAVGLAERVRKRFERARISGVDEAALHATVSAGCVELAADELDIAGLLERADVGLAMAKHAGRNQVVAA